VYDCPSCYFVDTANSEICLSPSFSEQTPLVAIMSFVQSWFIYSVTALVLVVTVDYARMLYQRQKMVNLPWLRRR
jgi:hypothetical protein